MVKEFSSEQLNHVIELKDKSTTIFTVKSKETNKDFTFKIKTKPFNGNVYTHVYVETGYLTFTYLGFYNNGSLIKDKVENKSNSAIAISWVLRMANQKKFDFLNDKVKLYHLGRCLCCNRKLSDAKSIEIGIGPHCRTKK